MNEKGLVSGEARKVLPGGEALVHARQETYLVANVLAGEQLLFRPLPSRRGVRHGEVVEITEASRERTVPSCEVAAHCGGCAFQYISETGQASTKSQWVSDAFAGVFEKDTRFISVADVPLHSRRRLRWYVQGEHIGFRARASHDVVESRHCPAVTPLLDTLRGRLQQWLGENDYSINSIQALELTDGIHLILEGDNPVSIEPPFAAVDQMPVQWWWRSGGVSRPLHKPVFHLHDRLPAGGDDISVAIGPDDFVQGQAAGNRHLIAKIVEWCEGARRVVDLFSGVGNLSLPVAAAHGATITGAEVNEASVRAANANAKQLGVNASYQALNLFGDFPTGDFAGADVLVLDPPRKGAKAVCSKMGTLLPGKIIMVNCDVASGARDASQLYTLGYRLRELHALDLFPYAGHVEALSLWTR